MIWSAQDKARDSVRRKGRGMSAARVAESVAGAAVREGETREQLRFFSGQEQDPYAPDPQELAELWAAKHVEWRRVESLMSARAGQRTTRSGMPRGLSGRRSVRSGVAGL